MNVDRAEQAGIWALKEFQQTPTNTEPGIPAFSATTVEDRWIISSFNVVSANVYLALSDYRFHEAANLIYDFFWGEFCDWYVELIKPRLASPDSKEVRAACNNLVTLFDAALRLLHPIMPFITEEIWHALYDGKPPKQSIALSSYPVSGFFDQVDASLLNDLEMLRRLTYKAQQEEPARAQMLILQDLIVSVRNLRAELKVEPKVKVPIQVFAHEAKIMQLIDDNRGALGRLANVESVTFVKTSLAKVAGARSTAQFDVHVVYEKKIDVAAECERLKKEFDKIDKEIANGQRQLGNEQFLAKAPAKVVEGLRARAEELKVLREKTVAKMKELGC
jgi:valyl-tRNA synthetase